MNKGMNLLVLAGLIIAMGLNSLFVIDEKEDGIEEKKEIGEIGIVENRDKVEEPEIFHEPRKVEFEGVEMEEIEID